MGLSIWRIRIKSKGNKRSTSASTAFAQPVAKSLSGVSEVEKYQNRDEHETFFRPSLKHVPKQSHKRKKKKQKVRPLTDKEKVKLVREDWEKHYGNTLDPTVSELLARTNPFESTSKVPAQPVVLKWETTTGEKYTIHDMTLLTTTNGLYQHLWSLRVQSHYRKHLHPSPSP